MGKIVIIGGGFGGVRTALDLARRLKGVAEITLIDRNSFHLFQPLLYETASAYGIKKDPFSVQLRKTIAIPYRDIFEGTEVHLVQGEVVNVDLSARTVMTGSGAAFPYDYLVLALGSETADFGIAGLRDYAHQFKNIEDALIVNRKIMTLFQQASQGVAAMPIRILVCGAGFTGIELAAEIACCARKLARQYRLKGTSSIITLFEAAHTILPNISDRERGVIMRRLTQLGVVIMAGTSIEAVKADSVQLKDGRMIKGDIVVWTGGVKANSFLEKIQGLPLTPKGKIIVDEHLNTLNDPRVFAVGDNVEFIDHRTQKPIPALAYLAQDHGRVVARNIIRSIEGKELKNHKPFYGAWIAPLGGKYAVAHLTQGITISGFLGWVIRQIVDLRYFLSILSFKKAFRLFREDFDIFTKND